MRSGSSAGPSASLRSTFRRVVETPQFNATITALIVINAITLGLETWPAAMNTAGPALLFLDQAALLVFTLELAMKLFVYRRSFFSDGWNVFDFVVIAIAWLPSSGPLSVLRALRILRVLRLVSVVPQLRAVVGALITALPGMGSILAVLILVFYVAAVMSTKLFGAAFPEWFGTIGASMYSLFQIMTLESWSMGIVRPVMQDYPFAWAFFVPFIVVTSFAVLNLFIALIVNSMQSAHAVDREAAEAEARLAHDERESLARQIQGLREELKTLHRTLRRDK